MHNEIQNIITGLFVALGYDVPEISHMYEGDVDLDMYSLTLDTPGMIIGKNGEGLRSLNHVVRAMAENKVAIPETYNFTVDVNDYYKKHIEELKTRASIVAERVKSFKRDMELMPMSAYDRLLLHSYLSKIPGITTESQGEGFERHIVIKYIEE